MVRHGCLLRYGGGSCFGARAFLHPRCSDRADLLTHTAGCTYGQSVPLKSIACFAFEAHVLRPGMGNLTVSRTTAPRPASVEWDPMQVLRDLKRWDPFREIASVSAAGGMNDFMAAFEIKETKEG